MSEYLVDGFKNLVPFGGRNGFTIGWLDDTTETSPFVITEDNIPIICARMASSSVDSYEAYLRNDTEKQVVICAYYPDIRPYNFIIEPGATLMWRSASLTSGTYSFLIFIGYKG